MPADLAALTRELDRLAASAHTPADGLAAARAIVKAILDAQVYRTLPKFEAEMLESHGYHDDAQAWWRKVKQLDEDIRADLFRLATWTSCVENASEGTGRRSRCSERCWTFCMWRPTAEFHEFRDRI